MVTNLPEIARKPKQKRQASSEARILQFIRTLIRFNSILIRFNSTYL
eukprot:COSAG04_NODE_863_length_9800_cov_12.998248_6_plen_47_part_00